LIIKVIIIAGNDQLRLSFSVRDVMFEVIYK